YCCFFFFFFFQAEDGIRDLTVTGVQTCALPICGAPGRRGARAGVRSRHELCRVVGLHEVDLRETASTTHLHRAWKAVQRRIDRQPAQPHWPPGQRLPPVLTHVAQDDELLLAQTSDPGLRTNVRYLLGGAAFSLAAAVSSDL